MIWIAFPIRLAWRPSAALQVLWDGVVQSSCQPQTRAAQRLGTAGRKEVPLDRCKHLHVGVGVDGLQVNRLLCETRHQESTTENSTDSRTQTGRQEPLARHNKHTAAAHVGARLPTEEMINPV